MAGVTYDRLGGEIWFNGEFVPWEDAKIHVLTHGLHYASSVFEGERAYGGKIFKLEEHTDRLFLFRNACWASRFPIPRMRSTRHATRKCAARVSPMPMSGRSRGAAAR